MKKIFVTCYGSLILLGAVATLWPTHSTVGAATRSGERGCKDEDGDGFGLGCERGPDCNDWDGAIHPARTEVCNFRDDDCDALVDNVEGCEAPPVDDTPVTVGAGEFVMGSDQGDEDERPVHQVYVSTVIVDRNEVTNGRYAACVAEGACTPPILTASKRRKAYYGNPIFADYPVVFVNWRQAAEYCEYAGGRLPTEAEWEKAARGETMAERTFPWGDESPTCALANLGGAGSCVGDTDRVGRRLEGQSPYGAFDMAGNVWEWVSDWYDSRYYDVTPRENPTGPEVGRLKVMRGGCWMSGADSLRVSCRKAELVSAWAANVGFRCAYGEGE